MSNPNSSMGSSYSNPVRSASAVGAEADARGAVGPVAAGYGTPAAAPDYRSGTGSNYGAGATGYSPAAGTGYTPGNNGYSPPNTTPYKSPASPYQSPANPAPAAGDPNDPPPYRPGSTSTSGDYVPRKSIPEGTAASPASLSNSSDASSGVVPTSYSQAAAGRM